jgi:hypothetical protein
VGAALRALLVGPAWSVIDPGDLFISLAMLAILIIVSARRTNDSELRDTLTYTAATFLFFFVAFFAVTSAFRILDEQQVESTFQNAITFINNKEYAKIASALAAPQPIDHALVDRLRALSVISSIITIPLAIECRRRYKLTE